MAFSFAHRRRRILLGRRLVSWSRFVGSQLCAPSGRHLPWSWLSDKALFLVRLLRFTQQCASSLRFNSYCSRFVPARVLPLVVVVGHDLVVIDGRIASCLLQWSHYFASDVCSISHSLCLYVTNMLNPWGVILMRLDHAGKIQSASLISATDCEPEEVRATAQGW
ncbi:hypothetical protein V8G54_017848 [Vigna mungo]|uniref:Uncharacterized protein n=1 Tax=Vigna mungo TaxID=3915 RepID=A0AAQ3NQH5_VIGMU